MARPERAAIVVMLGLGAVLLLHAIIGFGPAPRRPLAVEVGALAVIALLGGAGVAGVAYVI